MVHPNDRIETLLDAAAIQERVGALGRRIEADYRGKALTVLGVLKGSVFFLADLLRHVQIPLRLDFLRASSYGNQTVSSGIVQLSAVEGAFEGRHVLIVDDILDSGRTLHTIRREIERQAPASVKTCVLVDKKVARAVELEADYRAFEIPNVFIVGYGLDYAEHYRNLPYIAVLSPGEDAT